MANLGRLDEARAAVAAGLALNPDLTVSRFHRDISSDNPRNQAHVERVCAGLRAVGLPEQRGVYHLEYPSEHALAGAAPERLENGVPLAEFLAALYSEALNQACLARDAPLGGNVNEPYWYHEQVAALARPSNRSL